jgi:hypothetical protein
MHFRGAWIGEADVDTARHKCPHQTFRTVHEAAPIRVCIVSLWFVEDQSLLARFVKGFTGIAAIAGSRDAVF